MRDLIAEVTMSRAPPTLYGPLHEFAASLRLEFSKSIGCKNGMVLKGIKRHAAWLKDHPRGRMHNHQNTPLCVTFSLFFLFGGGGGGCPTLAKPFATLHWRGTRFWKRRSMIASPRCYPMRCMGWRMFVTNALQNRPVPDRSRRTTRGTLAS